MFSDKDYKNFTRFLMLVSFSVFLLGSFCIGSHPVVEAHAADHPNISIIQSNSHCCTTAVSTHLDLRRESSLLTVRSAKEGWLLLALGLLAYAVMHRAFRETLKYSPVFVASRLYFRRVSEVFPLNHYRLALAQGVLNPKIY